MTMDTPPVMDIPPFTARIDAVVTGEASHPPPETLTPEERAHLGIEEKGE